MTSHQERPAGEAEYHGGPAPTPEPCVLRPATPADEPWPAIGVGVAVSAGIYPCVALIPLIGLVAVSTLMSGGSLDYHRQLEALAGALPMAIILGVFLIFVTAVVCVPVLFVIWSMVRLLGLHLTWPAAGAFGGSAVGFAYFAPICYLGLQDLHWQLGGMVQPIEFVMLVVVVAIGPLLAVFVGQVGGAYGGVGIEQQRESLGLPGAAQYEGRMAFSIRQLLGLTVVVSLLLAALRLAGLLNSATFFLVGCWLVWHVVSRRSAIALARRLRRNRPGRGLLTMPATPTSGAPEPPVAGGSQTAMGRLAKRFIRPIPLPQAPPVLEDEGEPGPPGMPARLAFYADTRQGPWTYLACYLALGGGVYTILAGGSAVVWRTTLRAWNGSEWQWLIEQVLMQTAALAFGAILAAVGVGIVSLVVLFCLWSVVRFSRWRINWEILGCFAGALVALVLNLPTEWIVFRDGDPATIAWALCGGLLLATFCLQVAGAYAGISNQRDADRRLRRPASAGTGLSFSVGQLLVLTAVVSVPLGLLRAFGLLSGGLLALMGVWVVWQAISQYPARRIAQWRHNVRAKHFHDTLDRMAAVRRDAAAAPAE